LAWVRHLSPHNDARLRSSQTISKNEQLNILQTVVSTDHTNYAAFLRALRFVFPPAFARDGKRSYGQASRLISIGKLNISLCLHTRPITWSSSRSLQGSKLPGRSHLVEGFTLRCIQRFSLPDVATRRCRWRDNRYTRGPSNPVLSY
jgi:hypothetical protein